MGDKQNEPPGVSVPGVSQTETIDTGWLLGALACASAVIALGIAGKGLFSFQWLLDHETYAKVGLIVFLLCIIGALWCVHRWSIIRVDELSKRHSIETSPHPCYYCRGGDAFVVCSHCDSIQWETLRSWEFGDKAARKKEREARKREKKVRKRGGYETEKPRHWARAVFFAHHRWKLLAAVLSVVVVGTIAFAAQLQVRLWQQRVEERTAHQNQAREVINAMTSFRGALLDLTALCGARELLGSTTACTDRLRIVIDQYIHLSWHAPPLLVQLKKDRCSMPDGLELSRKACEVLDKEDTVDCMDQSFAAFVNAFSKNGFQARCDAARRFYLRGRRLGCIINLLYSGPDAEGVKLFQPCESSLQLPSNGQCADPGPSSANYDWDKWCGTATTAASTPSNTLPSMNVSPPAATATPAAPPTAAVTVSSPDAAVAP